MLTKQITNKIMLVPLNAVQPRKPFRYKKQWWYMSATRTMIYNIDNDENGDSCSKFKSLSPKDYHRKVGILKN